MNEEQGGFQELTGMNRIRGNRNLGGHADVTQWAKSAFWTPILAKLGLSWDDISELQETEKGLILTGGSGATNSFSSLVEGGTNNAYTAEVNSTTGQVTIKVKDKDAKMTPAQKLFYETLKDAVDMTQSAVRIDLVEGSEAIFIGHHDLQAIDVVDINAFGTSNAYVTCYSVLAHEVAEQVYNQRGVNSGSFFSDHYDAITKVEEKVSGNARDYPDPPSPAYNNNVKTVFYFCPRLKNADTPSGLFRMQVGSGTYNLGYTTSSGLHVIVTLTVVNNNITAIK